MCYFVSRRFVATLHQTSLLVPFFQQHLLNLYLCHILVTHNISNFSLLLYLLWWSVVSGPWCYYWDCKTALNWNVLCVFWLLCSTGLATPQSLSISLGLPIPWDKPVRPINNPARTLKCSSERKSYKSLSLNKNLEMPKLSEEATLKVETDWKLGLLCQLEKCKGIILKKIKSASQWIHKW